MYGDALAIADLLDRQKHDQVSLSLVAFILSSMFSGTPLSPLYGGEEEWEAVEEAENVCVNVRHPEMYRKKEAKDNEYSYVAMSIVTVTNEEEVLERYAFDPMKIFKYSWTMYNLREELSKQIVFPYIPETNYYRWDFDAEALVLES